MQDVKEMEHEWVPLVKNAVSKWGTDRATTMAAGLSYYTMFSIAPLLVIVIAVASIAFGHDAAQGRIVGELQGIVGSQTAHLIQTMLARTHKLGGGITATVLGIITLLAGATGVLVELQTDLNVVWKTTPKTSQGVMGFIKDRLLSIGLILVFGFLLLVSLVINAAVDAFGSWLLGLLPAIKYLLEVVNYLISLAVVAGVVAIIYKWLPNTEIDWQDVWVGALVTAILFSIGRFIIGLYMSHASVASSYGAAGSLVVLLLWIYYSSMIFLFGAEFTYCYAHTHGSQSAAGQEKQAAARAARTPASLRPVAQPTVFGAGGVAASHGGERHEAVSGGPATLSAVEKADIRVHSFIRQHLASVLGSAAASGLVSGVLLRRLVLSPKQKKGWLRR